VKDPLGRLCYIGTPGLPFLVEFHLMNGISDSSRTGGHLDRLWAGRFIPAF